MLNDAVCFKNVYIVTGYTDLRFGIDSLAALIKSKSGKEPFVPDTLYLFCGRRTDRIKGLVWESDGYLLLYKRLEQGNFQWPRSESEVHNLSQQQFHWLMEGLTVAPKKVVKQVEPPDRETVDKVEKMKVCTCLNPLHTCLAIYGCLFGYEKISDGEKFQKWTETLEMAIGIHYGVKRDNNRRVFNELGPDAGIDCINNFAPSSERADYLNALAETDELPKTIQYSLNPNDNASIGTIIRCFQDSSNIGKIQQGSGWWFNDNKTGMTEQMTSLANLGLLGNFIGMLTAEERAAYMEDIEKVVNAIHELYHPQKINYGAYGDTGHHLHFHLVPKYKDEYEWGGVFVMNPGENSCLMRNMWRWQERSVML